MKPPTAQQSRSCCSASAMASLLPAGVVTAAAYEPEWETSLLEAEEPFVAGATDRRRREFAAGRNCARRALAHLGVLDFPILAGEAREPLWPVGITGSITHGAGYCAAALAPIARVRSLGIDVAPNVPLPGEVHDLTCTPGELGRMTALAELDVPMLLFSAKESVYKAWYQIVGTWLDYLEVDVELDLRKGAFSARVLSPAAAGREGLPSSLAGRFTAAPRHIFTAVSVSAPTPRAG
jgi:4'-phosphopantetheinyl transferase EntD